MCLCKIHLHSRRGTGTIVKLCEHQNIPLQFNDYESFFQYIQAKCPDSNNENVYIPSGFTPTKKMICKHQGLRWESLKTQSEAENDKIKRTY